MMRTIRIVRTIRASDADFFFVTIELAIMKMQLRDKSADAISDGEFEVRCGFIDDQNVIVHVVHYYTSFAALLRLHSLPVRGGGFTLSP